jgi:diguanylate cyclase (GGDEF)-like protein
MINDYWLTYLEDQVSLLNKQLFTQKQFLEILEKLVNHENSPLTWASYELESQEPYKKIIIATAKTASNEMESLQTVPLEDNRGTKCKIMYKTKAASSVPSDLDQYLGKLISAFWKPKLRTESAGMIDLKRQSDAVLLANSTVNSCILNGASCSLIFVDIDNFKSVNDRHGQTEGDNIIKQLGALMEEIAFNDAILLHRGGDEFTLLIPNGGPEKALSIAFALKVALNNNTFSLPNQEQPESISISMGLASTASKRNTREYSNLEKEADAALKSEVKGIQKGAARFAKETSENLEKRAFSSLEESHCVIKSSVLIESPFSSIWLNCLSQTIYEAVKRDDFTLPNLKKKITDYIDWARPVFDSTILKSCLSSSTFGIDVQPTFSPTDCGLAIAHGLYRGGIESPKPRELGDKIIIKYNDENEFSEVLLCGLEEHTLWRNKEGVASSSEFNLGCFWELKSPYLSSERKTARALLIQIGYEALLTSSILYATKITVDDRPAKGGGLPDFWEATIAETISTIESNPNIDVVFVLGNHEYGKETVEKLKTVELWKNYEEHIDFKTGLPLEAVVQASKKLENKIIFVESESDLVQILSKRLHSKHTIQNIEATRLAITEAPLERVLSMSGIALNSLDGCRVRTISEAFPVVLEIARRGETGQLIRDQAGKSLRELIDFKVCLTDPENRTVPTFYGREEKLLEKYFQDQFLSPDGLFRSRLDRNNQFNAVLNHVSTVIQSGEKRYSTRRAILVIPHDITGDGELSPLGLVSIRVIPRFLENTVMLAFSYTWRTVEALVGFPYSLYGSVKFSRYICDEILKRSQLHTTAVKLGELSYIAHSLHIFMDSYGQSIARKISNDSTK